jgi:UDP-N-acetylmuramoyl-tripeptide--D-alanyl-D-alanine ligase
VDFSLDQPARVSGQVLDPTNNRFRLVAAEGEVEINLPLPGRHNVRNALAAAAAALAVGATLVEIRTGLESLHGVGGRMQRLPGRHGGAVIHDAYNANPASLAAALATVGAEPGRKWLVLGDMFELGPTADALHAQSGRNARAAGFERLYAVGEHSRAAVLAFADGGGHYETIAALIADLLRDLQRGEPATVLIKGSRGMRMEQVATALADAGDGLANLEGHN